jgi:electron transfer flavoprotein alpha/beta subunit
MFTELNQQDEPGLNHVHMFVDSLEEAQDACDFLQIPVITVGYPDLENALAKARATGVDESVVMASAGTPSFMVADLRKQVGFAVQFIPPRAKRLHDAILAAKERWDGSSEHMFIPLGG